MRYVLVLILSCFSIIGYTQDFVIRENDSTIITEYNDGKLWAYRHLNGHIVGLTCYEANDNYGNYYQMQLYINNLDSLSVTFDPNEINAHIINKKGETIPLEVYTNEEFQNKIEKSQNIALAILGFAAGFNAGMAGYSTSYSTSYSPNGYAYTKITTHYNPNATYQANLVANAQIATFGEMMSNERVTKEHGYLKKDTIHPNEGIVGYMNIKRVKGHILTINVPISGHVYSFVLDVSKKKNK